jgi:hypothetical protein
MRARVLGLQRPRRGLCRGALRRLCRGALRRLCRGALRRLLRGTLSGLSGWLRRALLG